MNKSIYLSLLQEKNYRRLLAANLINRLGDAIETLAFSWIVYAFTGEGTWAAIVFAVNNLPSVIALPFAGAYVEKRRKRQIMVFCDIVRCILVAILFLAMLAENLTLPLLLVFSFLVSLAEAFRIPASNSFILQILPGDSHEHGIILNVIVSTIVQIAGTAIGGIIISKFGAEAALLGDIVTFILSTLFILHIRHQETISAGLQKTNSFAVFREGLSYMKKRGIVLFVILLAVLANASMCPLDSLQTVVVVEIFQREADYLSVLNVFLSVGMLLGGSFYPTIKKKIKPITLFLLSFSYIGFLYLVIALLAFLAGDFGWFYYLAIILYFFYGIFASFLATGLGLYLLEKVETEYMARTQAVFSAASTAILPIVSGLSGILLRWLKIPVLFIGISALIFFFIGTISSAKKFSPS